MDRGIQLTSKKHNVRTFATWYVDFLIQKTDKNATRTDDARTLLVYMQYTHIYIIYICMYIICPDSNWWLRKELTHTSGRWQAGLV